MIRLPLTRMFVLTEPSGITPSLGNTASLPLGLRVANDLAICNAP